MRHETWEETAPIRQITCRHTDAKKYKVTGCLTPGKTYDLQNETEEFYFVKDDTGVVGGFYKTYFE
ncbi:DUF6501 family protein [Bacillus fonticola]|uniref:DUF6501 family protein n=1 Tax=Bacillus fonticola TaxID=2728853 RepID=UPI001474ED27|nr:DUF6501 family protein [Bacillus fonticola]